jgi:hypothetical protein
MAKLQCHKPFFSWRLKRWPFCTLTRRTEKKEAPEQTTYCRAAKRNLTPKQTMASLPFGDLSLSDWLSQSQSDDEWEDRLSQLMETIAQSDEAQKTFCSELSSHNHQGLVFLVGKFKSTQHSVVLQQLIQILYVAGMAMPRAVEVMLQHNVLEHCTEIIKTESGMRVCQNSTLCPQLKKIEETNLANHTHNYLILCYVNRWIDNSHNNFFFSFASSQIPKSCNL